ncbi:glycine N-acyltransferase-like protein 2 [Gracilinanus agilis]|uniref:glycine N-acyltransferase-like protein 2 n=1 Tax=Gracilinanus agilis TaxID=191870 RepID=UPI001CFD7715|nr:glycine N-acyltransferase-like protein 2 [Gracilinanus agilis]
MIKLHEAKMLHILYQSLTKSIPEALKVFGSIFHIHHGNPFNLEVLVDSWPDYQTVITRPQKQEMIDDKDYYTNTYHIFSKDLQKLPEILGSDHVINWRQSLTIQGCQNGLNEKIREVVALKSVHVDYSKRFLYMKDDVPKYHTFNPSKLSTSRKVKNLENVMFRGTNDNLRPSLLDVSHAKLVNDNWKFGRNERSLRYIKRCLQSFPGCCLLGPEGSPVSWFIMEQTGELRMSYTLPEYREKNIAKWILATFVQYFQENDMPFYCHVEEMNEQGHKLVKSAGFRVVDCSWHEWKCVPAEQL